MTIANIFPNYPSSLIPTQPKIYTLIWNYYNDPSDPEFTFDKADSKSKSAKTLPPDMVSIFVHEGLAQTFRKNRDLHVSDSRKYPSLSKRIKLCKLSLNLAIARTNETTRTALSKRKQTAHIDNTREQIMKEAEHLNPQKSVVIVCGSQWFDRKQKIVEPVQQLADRSKKILFVDCCETTVKLVASKVKPASKVLTQVLDLGGGFQDELVKLTAVAQEFKLTEAMVIYFTLNLWEEFKHTTAILPPIPFEAVLGDDARSIDYVISSLVASELASAHRDVEWMTQLLFKKSINASLDANLPDEMITYYNEAMLQNINNLARMHLTSACTWVNPQGRVYFADTTKIFNCSEKAMIGKSRLQPNTIERIKSSALNHTYKTWEYSLDGFGGKIVYQVESWILSKFRAPYWADVAEKNKTAAAGTATAANDDSAASNPSGATTEMLQEAPHEPSTATGSK